MSKLLRNGRLIFIRKDVLSFTSSIDSDLRLLKPVIKINIAHVIMMIEHKIISRAVGIKLLEALCDIKTIKKLKPSFEDIHMYVEEEVTKAVGPTIGGNLHIAKSRNDQVSTAIRIKLREALTYLINYIIEFQETLIETAEKHIKTIIPGYTHLQPAQPITFAHYLLSFVDALERDLNRISEAYARVNICPMGACAIATTSFPINRDRVAELLGFNGLLENSIDAVSARDFALETLSNLTLIAVHLSHMAEDFIIWSSQEFGLIELPDEFSSTSSIMPQKKNPDLLEVIRARMSRVIGDLMTCVATMKALPSGYNLDFQEITPRIWNSLECVFSSLQMLSKLLPYLHVNTKSFDKAVYSFTASTELANLLTRKYLIPFRISHKIVGTSIKTMLKKGLPATSITPELLEDIAQKNFNLSLKVSKDDINSSIDPLSFVEHHNVMGGPSPAEVKRMIDVRRSWVSDSKTLLSLTEAKFKEADSKMEFAIRSYLNQEM